MAGPHYGDGVLKSLSAPRVEPQRRKVGGRLGWAVHRFPIKGGISLQDAMNRDMAQRTSLFERLRRAG